MYFKKLELSGFKSFPSKTVLNFEPGITAVVGPNGCGKSNVFDSIRWVLGEQSVKALRGSKMEDVIFNGTEKKEPLGMAEVSLTFTNENKLFAIDDKEFVITRRIYRSGESEYLINRNQVRLKDITDLLMGTGIGAESYSLIEQGKIDLILSSRPEDRRVVFDEASGITKYKSQKREALRRLEDTENNLLRISDIVSEVKRQINSLERQANKARRYKEIFDQLKEKDITLATLQINKFKKERDGLFNQSHEKETKFKSTQNHYNQIIARQQSEAATIKELEDKIFNIKEIVINLTNLIERNDQHVNINKERIGELKKQKEILLSQVAQIKEKFSSDKEKTDNFNLEYRQLEESRQENENRLKKMVSEINEIMRSIKKSQDNILKAKKEVFEIITHQTNTKNSINDLNANLQTHLARKKRLEIEKLKVEEESRSIHQELNKAGDELTKITSTFDNCKAQYKGITQRIDKDAIDLETLNSEIQQLEKERAILFSQKEFLENLNLKYDEISESMNATILLDKIPKSNPTGMVIKIKGKISPQKGDGKISHPAVCKLSGEAKPLDLNPEGVLRKIDRINQTIEEKRRQISDKQEEMQELRQVKDDLELQLRQKEISLVNKQSQCDSIKEQLNKINEELQIIEMELTQTKEEVEKLEEKEAQLKRLLADQEAEQKKREKIISEGSNLISSLNSKKEENRVIKAQMETEIESLDQRLVRDKDTLKMLEATLKADQSRLYEFQEQITSLEERHNSLRDEIKKLEEENEKSQQAKKEMQEKQEEVNQIFTQKQQKLTEDTSGLEPQRQLIQDLKDEINKLEIEIRELDYRSLNVKDRILQSYKHELTLDKVSDWEDINETALSSEVNSLKQKVEAYGSVNLVAIEEYDELKSRYEFLTQQQNDLLSAKNSLHDAILKINRTTKKMFQETFKMINQEFRNYFRMLFGGGDANLFLIDENDPLESGIEIICRPPGKKLQNVSMLSGGEKSLSAIALIFSVFKVKPSPFCILDEVDAALDEANVDRYSRLLQEFTKDSQFIIITHNKRTIINADVMYGITMEEQGISKIVSVKFGQDKTRQDQSQEELVPA